MFSGRKGRQALMRTLPMIVLLAGCAAAPHVADTGISGAVIAGGGSELNPIGFPGVIVAKLAAEGVAESYRRSGDRYTCAKIAGAARLGSWVGTGATLGGLAGGPIGMGVGALFAVLAGDQSARDSAFETCYGPRGSVVAKSQPVGWGG